MTWKRFFLKFSNKIFTEHSQICNSTISVFNEYLNYPDRQNSEYMAFKGFTGKNHINYEFLDYNNQREQGKTGMINNG